MMDFLTLTGKIQPGSIKFFKESILGIAGCSSFIIEIINFKLFSPFSQHNKKGKAMVFSKKSLFPLVLAMGLGEFIRININACNLLAKGS